MLAHKVQDENLQTIVCLPKNELGGDADYWNRGQGQNKQASVFPHRGVAVCMRTGQSYSLWTHRRCLIPGAESSTTAQVLRLP